MCEREGCVPARVCVWVGVYISYMCQWLKMHLYICMCKHLKVAHVQTHMNTWEHKGVAACKMNATHPHIAGSVCARCFWLIPCICTTACGTMSTKDRVEGTASFGAALTKPLCSGHSDGSVTAKLLPSLWVRLLTSKHLANK